MAENPVQGFNQAQADIEAQTNTTDSRTEVKLNELKDFMDALQASASFIAPEVPNVTATTLNLEPGVISSIKPDRPDARLNALRQRTSEEPNDDFVVSIDDVSFPGAPFFAATLNQPIIPDAPEFTPITPADKPDIADPRALPSNVTDDRPTTFTVGNHNVPSPNTVTIPDFGEDIPVNTLVPPDQQFNYVEPIFELTLKDNITTKLNTDIISGGTGLDAAIEAAIFDRAEERDKLVLEDTIQAITDEWAGRGYTLPTGVLQELIEKARLEHDNNRLTTNRDIQKLQADLAQTNTHFTIDKGLNLVAQEFQHAHQVNERALRAEEALIRFAIALWDTKVTDHNLKLERVRIQAIQNASILEGEKLRLEFYRTELLELEAKSALDKDKINNYTAQVNSFNAKRGLFQDQVDAVKTSIAVEDLKLDFYKSQTADFTARVNAENVKFASHVATVNGELGKVRVFASQVDAYAAEVAGARLTNDAQIAKLNKNIRSEEIRLQGFVANINKWRDKVALAQSELGFESGMFGKDIDSFVAETQRDTAQASLGLKTSEMGQRLDIENLKVTAATLNSNLQGTLAAAGIRLEAQKAMTNTFMALLTSLVGSVQSILTLEGKAEITEATTTV